MLSLPASVRIFVAREPADMRKSFNGLSNLVCDMVDQDPQSGHLFVFFNRRRDLAKILWWDRSGFWLLSKRLERGRFAIFDQANGDASTFSLTSSDLMLILNGVDLRGMRRRAELEEAIHS